LLLRFNKRGLIMRIGIEKLTVWRTDLLGWRIDFEVSETRWRWWSCCWSCLWS